MSIDAQPILASYAEVRKRIEMAAGNADRAAAITLVAVSKTKPADAVEVLYRAGHRDFGENYAQELVEKALELSRRGCSGIRWHFIGHLQTNKAKMIVPHVAAVHSIDSEKLAVELAKRWKILGRAGRLPVFIEVNVGGEETKSGVVPTSVRELAEKVSALPEVSLEGLMCIPPPGDQGSAFAKLRDLEGSCRPATTGKLSMGMTDDFEAAIAEGATHVRVGSAIFGQRVVGTF